MLNLFHLNRKIKKYFIIICLQDSLINCYISHHFMHFFANIRNHMAKLAKNRLPRTVHLPHKCRKAASNRPAASKYPDHRQKLFIIVYCWPQKKKLRTVEVVFKHLNTQPYLPVDPCLNVRWRHLLYDPSYKLCCL